MDEINPIISMLGRRLRLAVIGGGPGSFIGAIHRQAASMSIAQSAGVWPVMECPIGVEARKRVNTDGDEVFVLINHERAEKRVPLPWLAHEHLNRLDTHELQLEPYGVVVITRAEKDGNK